MRIYLAGPMRNLPELNFPAFDAYAAQIAALGHTVINPAELDRQAGYAVEVIEALPPKSLNEFIRDAMARDTAELCKCDAIAMLPGWRNSEGAMVEYHLANLLGLLVLDADTMEPISENVLQEASRITSGDRNGDYGHPADHWMKTTGMINALYGTDLKPRDWGMMMVCDKLARESHKAKRDSLVDICGYARCIEKVDERNA